MRASIEAKSTVRRRAIAGVVGLVSALALVISGCSSVEPVDPGTPPQLEAKLPAETATQLQDAVAHAMAASGSSGAIVGVWAPWSGEWVAGVGTEKVGGGRAVTADLTFPVGPVTRAMTCDVLFAVAASGAVALDDSITKYVSGVADLGEISLRELCDSTSGIGSYRSQLQGLWLANPERTWHPKELVSYGLGKARTTEPGVAYRESDAGYVLLGLALERATGKTAAELLEQYVVAPLGLTETRLQEGPPSLRDVLDGHISLKNAEGTSDCAEPVDATQIAGRIGYSDAGAVSDIDDLGRYARALATGALLPPGTDRFEHAVAPSSSSPSWLTTGGGAFRAGSLIGQYGSVPGYLTAAFADPDTGLTVAVVLNNSALPGAIAANLAWELAAIASKAAPASGETTPEAGLPWTADQFHEAITAAAICPLP